MQESIFSEGDCKTGVQRELLPRDRERGTRERPNGGGCLGLRGFSHSRCCKGGGLDAVFLGLKCLEQEQIALWGGCTI